MLYGQAEVPARFFFQQFVKGSDLIFSNLIASLVLIAFEVWAWLQTNNIKTAKKAAVQPSTFPRIMIIGMAVFTVILLIQSLIKLISMKADDPLAEKAETMNLFRDKGVLAALVVILLCVGYVYLFKSLGYVVVSFLLCAIIMWMIGLRSPVKLILISLLVPLGMWLIFYKMLQVNIPMGWLQFLKDLVVLIHDHCQVDRHDLQAELFHQFALIEDDGAEGLRSRRLRAPDRP